MPLNIYRSRGIEFCVDEPAPSGRANWRENAVITTQPSHESENEIVIKRRSRKIMRQEKKEKKEKDYSSIKHHVVSVIALDYLFKYLATGEQSFELYSIICLLPLTLIINK